MEMLLLIMAIAGTSGLTYPSLCGPPPTVLNAIVAVNNGTLTYTCFDGYAFADKSLAKSSRCIGSPASWTSVDHSCTAKSACSNLSSTLPPGVFSDTSDTYVGTVVNIRCQYGTLYKANQLTILAFTCAANGFWDRLLLPCSNVTCPRVDVSNATQVISDGVGNYGSTSTWTCVPGTSFPGGQRNFTAACTATGLWSTEPPLSGCQVGYCTGSWVRFDGHCYSISDSVTGQLRREVAATSCGIKNSQLAVADNDAENAFLAERSGLLGSVTPEEAVIAYWLGPWRSGKFWVAASSPSWLPANLSYTKWQHGYPENLGDCVQLAYGGFWKDKPCDRLSPYICERPQDCGQLPVIKNGALELPTGFSQQTQLDITAVLTYACNPGYQFPSSHAKTMTVTCTTDGVWSYLESCQAVTCPPVSVNQAYILERSIKTDTVNTTVVIKCKKGYVLPGGQTNISITCQESGLWFPAGITECTTAQCSLPAVQNAVASLNVNAVGAMDFYVCKEGYWLDDNSTQLMVTCMSDGTWFPRSSGCQNQQCPTFEATNAVLSSTVAYYLDKVQVQCLPGYRLAPGVFTQEVTCLASGTWSSSPLSCQQLFCPQPPDISNAFKSTNSTAAGTLVNYTCFSGYSLSAGQQWVTAVCDLDTATWIFEESAECAPIPGDDSAAFYATSELYASLSIASAVVLLSLTALIGSALQKPIGSGDSVDKDHIRMVEFNSKIKTEQQLEGLASKNL